MHIDELLKEFMSLVASGDVEVYNEFSLSMKWVFFYVQG